MGEKAFENPVVADVALDFCVFVCCEDVWCAAEDVTGPVHLSRTVVSQMFIFRLAAELKVDRPVSSRSSWVAFRFASVKDTSETNLLSMRLRCALARGRASVITSLWTTGLRSSADGSTALPSVLTGATTADAMRVACESRARRPSGG